MHCKKLLTSSKVCTTAFSSRNNTLPKITDVQ